MFNAEASRLTIDYGQDPSAGGHSMREKMPPSINASGSTGIQAVAPHSLRHNQETPSSSQFVAFDIKSPFFSCDSRRKEELAELYMRIFNSVEAVPDQWSLLGAQRMVDARLSRTGCNIALVDISADKIIGAFLSNIIPGPFGPKLTEPDVLLDDAYRGKNLGAELSWLGRAYADEISVKLFSERLVTNESKTYKEPAFPKTWWEKNGYVLGPLFTFASAEVVQHVSTAINSLRVDDIKRDDLPELVSFIADRENVISSDGMTWDRPHAEAYVKFMFEQHYDTFIVTKAGERIVAISSADIMPGRTGPSMVEPHIFLKHPKAIKRDGLSGLTPTKIFATSLSHLIIAAGGISKHQWQQGISAVEIPQHSSGFFKQYLPNLQEDPHFIGMDGSHQTLMSNLSPASAAQRKIQLVRFNHRQITAQAG